MRVEIDGRPTARGVLLDDAGGALTVADTFELTGDDVEFAQQLHDLAKATSSRLQALQPQRVVVRRADFPPAGSRKEAPKLRLLAEGAITASAREHVPATYLGTGQEIGAWDGRGKDGVEAASRPLVQAAGLTLKWVEATAAGLGAAAHP